MKAYVQKVAHSQESSFVYRVKSDPRFARGWHFHPEYELTWIQASQGRRYVGDSVENYRPGDLVLLGPNLPHTWTSEPRASEARTELHRAIVIQFGQQFLGESFFNSPELRPVTRLLERSRLGLQITGKTKKQVSDLLLEMRKQERLQRLLHLLQILEILAKSTRDLRPICSTPASTTTPQDHQARIDKVFSWLNEHYTGSVKQEEAAQLLGLTPAGFSRFFKRATGTTFAHYLGELRISHACNLLIDTDDSILTVSLNSGFNNLSNFNRRFLAMKEITPREYRSRYRGR